MVEQTKFLLDEKEMPTAWHNVQAHQGGGVNHRIERAIQAIATLPKVGAA